MLRAWWVLKFIILVPSFFAIIGLIIVVREIRHDVGQIHVQGTIIGPGKVIKTYLPSSGGGGGARSNPIPYYAVDFNVSAEVAGVRKRGWIGLTGSRNYEEAVAALANPRFAEGQKMDLWVHPGASLKSAELTPPATWQHDWPQAVGCALLGPCYLTYFIVSLSLLLARKARRKRERQAGKWRERRERRERNRLSRGGGP